LLYRDSCLIAGTGAVEKQKFVYVMHRDSSNRLTISSPLEAHKSETIVFAICGVDNGFDNPIFAMIELEYGEADQDYRGEGKLCAPDTNETCLSLSDSCW
jgi:hypothetical protein